VNINSSDRDPNLHSIFVIKIIIHIIVVSIVLTVGVLGNILVLIEIIIVIIITIKINIIIQYTHPRHQHCPNCGSVGQHLGADRDPHLEVDALLHQHLLAQPKVQLFPFSSLHHLANGFLQLALSWIQEDQSGFRNNINFWWGVKFKNRPKSMLFIPATSNIPLPSSSS